MTFNWKTRYYLLENYTWLLQKPERRIKCLLKKTCKALCLYFCHNCTESDCDHCLGSHMKCIQHHLSPYRLRRYIHCVHHQITSQSKSSTTTQHPDTLYLFDAEEITFTRTALPPEQFKCNYSLGNPYIIMLEYEVTHVACHLLAWNNIAHNASPTQQSVGILNWASSLTANTVSSLRHCGELPLLYKSTCSSNCDMYIRMTADF